MALWEGRVRSGFVRLHFLASVPEVAAGEGTPLVIVPGTAEAAEDYADLLEALAPRPCFALSLRGRGQSAAPEHGYRLADHVADIEALVAGLELSRPCLMGYSRGAVYALAWAIEQTARPYHHVAARPYHHVAARPYHHVAARPYHHVAGLIIQDHPAHHPALPPEWTERFLRSTCRGTPVSERLMPHVVESLQREGEDIRLWDALPGLTCPVLIMYGAGPGSRLPLAGVQRYLERLPDARTARFENSGHRLWEPDFGQYVLTIAAFLARLDPPA